VAAGLEADAVDGGVDLARAAQDLLELLAQVVVGRQVDGLAAEAGRLAQPVRVHVADDDHAAPSRWAEVAQASPTGPAPAM
jgi:hypothetical protein